MSTYAPIANAVRHAIRVAPPMHSDVGRNLLDDIGYLLEQYDDATGKDADAIGLDLDVIRDDIRRLAAAIDAGEKPALEAI